MTFIGRWNTESTNPIAPKLLGEDSSIKNQLQNISRDLDLLERVNEQETPSYRYIVTKCYAGLDKLKRRALEANLGLLKSIEPRNVNGQASASLSSRKDLSHTKASFRSLLGLPADSDPS